MSRLKRLHPRRLGRRGAFLLLFGAAWSLIGWSSLGRELTAVARRLFDPLLQVAPFDFWAHIWLLAGVLALVAAFLREPGQDSFGFGALIVPPMLWAGSASVSSFIPHLWGQAMVTTVVYLAISVAIFIVAGWPEVPWRNGDKS